MWSPSQRQELLRTGKVSSVTGHHINSVATNPDWKGDPRNIVFLDNDGGRGGDHLHSNQGHRGNYRNQGNGRLIDRKKMIEQYRKANGIEDC